MAGHNRVSKPRNILVCIVKKLFENSCNSNILKILALSFLKIYMQAMIMMIIIPFMIALINVIMI